MGMPPPLRTVSTAFLICSFRRITVISAVDDRSTDLVMRNSDRATRDEAPSPPSTDGPDMPQDHSFTSMASG